MRTFLFCLCVVLGALAHPTRVLCQSILNTSIPDPAVPAQGTPIAVAGCTVPPVIDGDLGDPCWGSATHADGFYRYGGIAPVTQQTEAWLCADRDHLYVAFHCVDTHPEMIKAVETIRDGDISNDDYVSVEIDSQNTRRNASTFSVSARGTQTEYIEGGTADNITWAGDWKAAVKRVPNGWTAEISIPFKLLRYPRKSHAMGILLTRKLAREEMPEAWPYMTRDEQQHSVQYLTTFTGVNPPDYAPRPIFLPYGLVTAGEGTAVHEGLDVKYPFTTSMTGLLTINPDFQDVAQQVNDINFSYVQKYYSDSRPFFAEGSGYMPYSDVFYSRAIGDIDAGVKVAGKQGPTTIAALVTGSDDAGGQNDIVASAYQEIGKLSDVHISMAQDQQSQLPSSRVVKFEGVYGWQAGPTQYSITANHMPSWVDNRPSDASDYFGFSTSPLGGKPYYSANWNDIGPRFTNNIGYIPEVDMKGGGGGIGQSNSFDTGKINYYNVNVNGSYYNHHTGGFFNKAINFNGYLSFRSGWSGSIGSSRSEWEQYRDHVDTLGVNWGGKTLYARGSVSYAYGTQEDEPYRFLYFDQSYPAARSITVEGTLSRLWLGDSITTQTVLSGTYRLTSERSIGLRDVVQDHDNDLFVSFAQRVRAGQDIYVLVGDPNSPTTRGLITLKVVAPF